MKKVLKGGTVVGGSGSVRADVLIDGEKVADCICLFALHHLEAFPVDTHIRQALELHYKRGFPARRYRGMQGILQQYIFYYELMGKKMNK